MWGADIKSLIFFFERGIIGDKPQLSTSFKPEEAIGNFTMFVGTVKQANQLGASNS